MSKDGGLRAFLAAVFTLAIGACASSEKKQRQVIREQVTANSKFYCEFLNGEKYTDIDVALNIAIGEKCDTNQQFSVTSYRSISDIPGVIYCCSLKLKGEKESRKLINLQPVSQQLHKPSSTVGNAIGVSNSAASNEVSSKKDDSVKSQESRSAGNSDGVGPSQRDSNRDPSESR